MKKLLITASLLLLLFLKPLFAGVAKGVDVREVQTILTELCFNPGPIDGVWGKKTEKAAEEFFTKYFTKYGGYLGHMELKMLQASNRAGVVGGKELKRCSPSISDKLAQRKTINIFNAWNDKYGLDNVGLFWTALARGPSRNTILLRSLGWNYHYAGQSWEWTHPEKNKYTIDKNDKIVDGNKDISEIIKDKWVLERDTSSNNPNWKLVETDVVND